MPFRHQYIFNAGPNGWAETWYSSAYTNQNDAHAAFVNTGPLRQLCCAPSVYIQAMKTIAVGGSRLSQLTPGTPTGGGIIAIANYRAQTYIDVLMRTVTVNGNGRRNVNFRGVVDTWVQANLDGAYLLSPTLQARIDAWSAVAFPAGGGFLSLQQLTPVVKATAPHVIAVTSVPPFTGSPVGFQTDVAHGLSQGDKITLQGMTGSNLQLLPPAKQTLNGIWTVGNVATPTTFTINLLDTWLSGVPVLTQNGTIFARVYQYPAVAYLQFNKVSRRATGKAFFVPPGHRRGRARLA